MTVIFCGPWDDTLGITVRGRDMAQNPDVQQAQAKIAEILQSWPLYRHYPYNERLLLLETDQRGVYFSNPHFKLPQEIVLLPDVRERRTMELLE